MKKFQKYFPIAVFGLMAYLCVMFLTARIYEYFTYSPLKDEAKISAPVIPLEEVAIFGPAVRTVESPAIVNAAPSYSHSNTAWLLCEEMANGSAEAAELLNLAQCLEYLSAVPPKRLAVENISELRHESF